MMQQPKITLLLASINQFITWGILYYSFSVMIIPFQEAHGWSETWVSGGFSLALLVTGVLSVPVGFLLDRIGPRPILRTGVLLAPFLLLSLSFVTEIWQYYLIWFLIGVIMSMTLYEPALKLVSQLPLNHEKSYAFLTMVAGTSSVVFAPLGEVLVRHYPYQYVLWFYAILLLLLVVPSNYVATSSTYSRVPKSNGKISIDWLFHSEIMRFLSGIFFNTFCTTTILVMGVLWLIKTGESPQFGALILGLIGLMSLPARLFVTQLHRFKSGYHVFSFLIGIQLVSCFISFYTDSVYSILLFAVLFGLSLGAITPLRAVLTQQEYGHLGLGGVNGVVAFVTTLARAAGPLTGAWLLQIYDSTAPFSWLLVISSFISLLFMMTMLRKKINPLKPMFTE